MLKRGLKIEKSSLLVVGALFFSTILGCGSSGVDQIKNNNKPLKISKNIEGSVKQIVKINRAIKKIKPVAITNRTEKEIINFKNSINKIKFKHSKKHISKIKKRRNVKDRLKIISASKTESSPVNEKRKIQRIFFGLRARFIVATRDDGAKQAIKLVTLEQDKKVKNKKRGRKSKAISEYPATSNTAEIAEKNQSPAMSTQVRVAPKKTTNAQLQTDTVVLAQSAPIRTEQLVVAVAAKEDCSRDASNPVNKDGHELRAADSRTERLSGQHTYSGPTNAAADLSEKEEKTFKNYVTGATGGSNGSTSNIEKEAAPGPGALVARGLPENNTTKVAGKNLHAEGYAKKEMDIQVGVDIHRDALQPPTPPPSTPHKKKDIPLAPICGAEDKFWFNDDFNKNLAPALHSAEVLSFEGDCRSQNARWYSLSAPEGYWDLIFMKKPEDSGVVPLVSDNTARGLAMLLGAELQEESAIIYGKLSGDYRLSISTRAEQIVYLDSNFREVKESDPNFNNKKTKYFFWLNVAPDPNNNSPIPVVFLDGKDGHGAVSVPVIRGTASYLELTGIAPRELKGRVLDAESEEASALQNIAIHVVGKSGKVAITDGSGQFTIPSVLVVNSYPVYLETMGTGGYIHRYRILGDNFGGATLFRFSEAQISRWINQLEGGVSVESGLIVGALPGVVSEHAGEALYPGLDAVDSEPQLKPEVYTLSEQGYLLVNNALTEKRFRFLGIQVPEGGRISFLENLEQRVVWSEYSIISPGVVNVIGPQ